MRLPASTRVALVALAACKPVAGAGAPEPSGTPAPARAIASEQGEGRLSVIARGLSHPRAVAPLPEGGFLVTERSGTLRRVDADGRVSAPLAGVPVVHARGQGGLLDVVLAPDFAQSRRIYLSYAEPDGHGLSGTAAAHATLGDTGLGDVTVFYRQQPKLDSEHHYGSRLAFDDQGHVFVSQGERGQRPMAQELDKLQGKLVRLRLDGSVP